MWEEGVSGDNLPGVCVGGGGGLLVRMIYLESVWEGGISKDDLPGAYVGGGC